MQEKIVLPYAPILVESTRSVGYSFETALADIIDNSIGKGAKNIEIRFDSNEPRYIAVIDDAIGMNEEELVIAMRYGSKSSEEIREKDDLGRFGLGLKMASLSQCRKLTVISKTEDNICAAQWDLDYIIENQNWSLKWFNQKEIKKLLFSDNLDNKPTGTIVLWENFDRMLNGAVNPQKIFDEKVDIARKHVSLVFHRFLGDENISKRVNLFFNGLRIQPLDPFLSKHPATQPLVEQTIWIGENQIKVQPYILPYISKLSAKDRKKLEGADDLRQNQGFYIYRNRRLIIWGTWFRLIKQQELNKLARVRVDIPNSLDSLWDIDIKKSRASLPDIIKKQLVTIVENAVGRSEQVYKYRGRKVNEDGLEHVWNIVNNRGSFQYQINREMPLYRQLEDALDENSVRYLDSLIKVLEDTFPYGDVYYRMAKNESVAKTYSLEEEEAYKVAVDMIESVRNINGDVGQFIKTMDKIDFFVKYPDVVNKIKEDMHDDR